LNRRPSARQAPIVDNNIDWMEFRKWCKNKYSNTWGPTVFCYAKKYHQMLNGDFSDLEAFSKSKKNSVLKALVALSKYLGVYTEFKLRMSDYGVKFEQTSSVDAFLRIMNAKHDILDWVSDALECLDDSQRLFIKFKMLSGIRTGEAINSFNKIIELSASNELEEYYNSKLNSLEHFKYPDLFLRGKKNVFFSFIKRDFIEKIAGSTSVSYGSLRKRVWRNELHMRLKELRDYYATFMVHNGLIREEVDLLQGRVGKSIFMQHYFSPNIEDIRDRVFTATDKMTR
jgi:intergrase/recombinase